MESPASTPRMAGTVALVTDVSGPVGQAVARRLASECTRLVLASPDAASARSTLDEVARIRALHRLAPEPVFVEADARTPGGAHDACAAALDAFGRLDAVVHTGALEVGGGDGVTPLTTGGAMAPDVAAFVPGIRAAAGAMGRSEGNVVLAALLDGAWPGPLDGPAKTAAIASFRGFVHAAARALYEVGLTLNGLVVEDPEEALGFAEAFGLGEARPMEAWHADRQRRSHQLYDAAHAARFLASNESRGIAGQTLLVSGGRPPFPCLPAADPASFAHHFRALDLVRARHVPG